MPAPQCLYADRLSSLGRLLTGFLPCCVHDAATVTGPSPQVSVAQATVYRPIGPACPLFRFGRKRVRGASGRRVRRRAS